MLACTIPVAMSVDLSDVSMCSFLGNQHTFPRPGKCLRQAGSHGPFGDPFEFIRSSLLLRPKSLACLDRSLAPYVPFNVGVVDGENYLQLTPVSARGLLNDSKTLSYHCRANFLWLASKDFRTMTVSSLMNLTSIYALLTQGLSL